MERAVVVQREMGAIGYTPVGDTWPEIEAVGVELREGCSRLRDVDPPLAARRGSVWAERQDELYGPAWVVFAFRLLYIVDQKPVEAVTDFLRSGVENPAFRQSICAAMGNPAQPNRLALLRLYAAAME